MYQVSTLTLCISVSSITSHTSNLLHLFGYVFYKLEKIIIIIMMMMNKTLCAVVDCSIKIIYIYTHALTNIF